METNEGPPRIVQLFPAMNVILINIRYHISMHRVAMVANIRLYEFFFPIKLYNILIIKWNVSILQYVKILTYHVKKPITGKMFYFE